MIARLMAVVPRLSHNAVRTSGDAMATRREPSDDRADHEGDHRQTEEQCK